MAMGQQKDRQGEMAGWRRCRVRGGSSACTTFDAFAEAAAILLTRPMPPGRYFRSEGIDSERGEWRCHSLSAGVPAWGAVSGLCRTIPGWKTGRGRLPIMKSTRRSSLGLVARCPTMEGSGEGRAPPRPACRRDTACYREMLEHLRHVGRAASRQRLTRLARLDPQARGDAKSTRTGPSRMRTPGGRGNDRRTARGLRRASVLDTGAVVAAELATLPKTLAAAEANLEAADVGPRTRPVTDKGYHSRAV